MKYSITDKPSLKFDWIGLSIISPPPIIDFLGFAIKPLIPANCFIWSPLPLAPESAIMYTELNPSSSDFKPFIISAAISLVAFVQTSITLLYLSPSVKMCRLNLPWIFSTSFSAPPIILCFSSGIRISLIEIDIPLLVAVLNPISLRSSKSLTVLSLPAFTKDSPIIKLNLFFEIISS